MLTLSAKIRQVSGKKVKDLRKKGVLPAILYGPKIKKSLLLEVDYEVFEKIYKEAGESSIIKLKIKDQEPATAPPTALPRFARALRKKTLKTTTAPPAAHQAKKTPKSKIEERSVLIKEVTRHPLTEEFLHVDFYQPKLGEEIEATIPLIFEGQAPAVKELGGTLIKIISEIEIKALPKNLPKEIKVNVEKLKTFADDISISDLEVPEGVKILKSGEEVVAQVAAPEKVEEELEKPIEEKVEEVEKVEEEKEEEGERSEM